ncbi:hypothetical protein F5Y03DRAFT_369953 [Xylaria venustula]|nr:hypothetical protein F5Y03DRAFT_369953 [Xylaria venustula]
MNQEDPHPDPFRHMRSALPFGDMAQIDVSISDDWEHVIDDDVYSVHSLPDSDVDSLDTIEARRVVTTLTNPLDKATQTSNKPPSESPPRSDQSIKLDGNKAVERCGMDTRDVVAPDTPDAPATPATPATPANPDPQPAEPRKIHFTHPPAPNTITTYREFDQVSGLVILTRALLSLPINKGTKASLDAICLHLVRLEGILTEYAKYRNTSARHPSLPRGLDPWLEALRFHLTSPVRILDSEETTPGRPYLAPKRFPASYADLVNCQYEHYLSLLDQMDEYMLVIESDLSDFRLLYSPTMPLENNKQSTIRDETPYDNCSRLSKPAASGSTNIQAVPLRRALQLLRNQLAYSLDEMVSCRHRESRHNREQWERLVVFNHSYRTIKETIDYMLDSPDHLIERWIDHDKGSVPSDKTIRSITTELSTATGTMAIERMKTSSLYRRKNPDRVPQAREEKTVHNKMVMDTLEGLESMICSVLRIQRGEEPCHWEQNIRCFVY